MYTGLGSGLALLRSPVYQKKAALPTVSLILGSQFFVHDYFYFFLESQLNLRKNVSNTTWNTTLCVSGGLGLQLPTKKRN
jgi:hypothetical protein